VVSDLEVERDIVALHHDQIVGRDLEHVDEGEDALQEGRVATAIAEAQ
jgi:hypothetical protein